MTEFLWKEAFKDKFKNVELIKDPIMEQFFMRENFGYHGNKFKNEEKYLSCCKGESTVAL